MARTVPVAVAISALLAGGAVACFFKVARLKSDAQWLSARGAAEAEAYVNSFDGALADRQLSTFEQRRTVLESALVWQRLELVLILAAVVAAFCSYILFLIGRLHQQLVDATGPGQAEEERGEELRAPGLLPRGQG